MVRGLITPLMEAGQYSSFRDDMPEGLTCGWEKPPFSRASEVLRSDSEERGKHLIWADEDLTVIALGT